LLALLVQGCNKDDSKTGAGTNATTNAASPTFVEPSATNTAVAATPASATPATASPATPEASKPTVPDLPPATTTAASDYKIQAGDNFSTLSKKFHVTTKALLEANPGVEPTKLQVNQVIHIPAAMTTAAAPMGGTGAAPATVEATNGEAIYAVKSGDTLTSIAHDKKVSVKELRSSNNLKTDSIKVGQKLNIPKTARAAADSTAATASITMPAASARVASR